MSAAGIDLSVVIPVHDEAQSLPILYRELCGVLDGLGRAVEIIFVDDASADGSAAVLRRLTARDARVRLLRLRAHAGLTAAFDAGYRAARGAVVVTLDADLQNDPRDIPRLLDALDGADAATGWRRVRRDPWLKRVASRVGNGVRRLVTGDPVHDGACSLRAVRRACLADLVLLDGLHRVLPTLLAMAGHRVVEIPVNHRPRRFGRSKFGVRNRAWRGLVDLLAVRWLMASRLRYVVVDDAAPVAAVAAARPRARRLPTAVALVVLWFGVAVLLAAWGTGGHPNAPVRGCAGTPRPATTDGSCSSPGGHGRRVARRSGADVCTRAGTCSCGRRCQRFRGMRP